MYHQISSQLITDLGLFNVNKCHSVLAKLTRSLILWQFLIIWTSKNTCSSERDNRQVTWSSFWRSSFTRYRPLSLFTGVFDTIDMKNRLNIGLNCLWCLNQISVSSVVVTPWQTWGPQQLSVDPLFISRW